MNTKTLEELTSSDLFDSREVIERIAELDADDPDDADELAELQAFAEYAAQYVADWQYGEAFIWDGWFTEYAEELANDIGAVDSDASWPIRHIDWEAAAKELQYDYFSFELGGRTWWAR